MKTASIILSFIVELLAVINCSTNICLTEIAMLLPVKPTFDDKYLNETDDRLNDVDSKFTEDAEHASKQ